MLSLEGGIKRRQCLARSETGLDNKNIPLCCFFLEILPPPDSYKEVEEHDTPIIFKNFHGTGRDWVAEATATFGEHRVLIGGF